MAEACCPPTALPYLEAVHTAKGTVVQADGVELYEAPPPETPKAALLVCPDVWGWNGGRVRAIADSLAAEGYFVVVGKFLSTPALDGGTDGDALPPGGAFSMDWIKNFPWSSQQSKVHNALAYCKTRVAALAPSLTCKIGVLGFCYGGHPACYASIEDESVACCVVMHPSMQIETFAVRAAGEPECAFDSFLAPCLI